MILLFREQEYPGMAVRKTESTGTRNLTIFFSLGMEIFFFFFERKFFFFFLYIYILFRKQKLNW